MFKHLNKIHDHIATFAPIHGVEEGDDGSITIDFKDEATAAQRKAAQDELDSLDPDKPTKDMDELKTDVGNLNGSQKQQIDDAMRAEYLASHPELMETLNVSPVRKKRVR